MKEFKVTVTVQTFNGRIGVKILDVSAKDKETLQQGIFCNVIRLLCNEEDSEMLEDAVFDFSKININIAEND